MRKLQVIGLLASAVALAGCSSGSKGAAGASAAFDVATIEPGKECPSGGERVKVGLDDNHNGKLEDGEVTDSYVTCNGSTLGNDGASPLIQTEQEPPGKHCENGGARVETGIDQDGDGTLSAAEVDKTTYVCAPKDGKDGAPGATGEEGVNGQDGKDGHPGTNGQSSLISSASEPAGSHCASGGALITGGLDVNANGVLDPSEVTATAYVCNGVASLARTSFESPGDNCLHGGFRIDTGTDSNLDGVLSDPEVKTSNYVCNGANGLNGGADGSSSLVKTVAEPAGAHCAAGGVRIDMGIDDNQNTVLDPSEVDSSSYICAGANGLDGALSLVKLTAEPGGIHCAAGGVKVDSGVDDNRDTVLQAGEVDATSFVCNGSAGVNGLNGLGNLLNTGVELPGVNCAAGGFKISNGADLNANGVLDTAEISSTNFLCNGINGSAGVNGLTNLVKTVLELPGANCAAGGLKVTTGADLNANGVLDNSEVTVSNFVCNGLNGLAGAVGTNGLSNLTKTLVELPGTNCAAGGFKVTTGLDSNANLVLDAGEVTATNYLCNGINGLAGAAGTNGTNGLLSLVSSALELPGANCLLGGVKIGSGLDTNKNGILDASEVTANSYACNGQTGATGSTGLSSVVKTSLELPGTHCLLGGLRIDTGVDTNKNNVLDTSEITGTTYQCTLG